ncbi:hypothetical protein K9M42_02785 [Patescibacteria group bacterium]|nr:hypothetical protein [Patescibacteria group bacterium]
MKKKIDIKSKASNKIRLIGSDEYVNATDDVLLSMGDMFKNNSEGEIRDWIQKKVIHVYKFAQKIDILYDGNTVINDIKILKNLRKIKRQGMEAMNDDFYDFLHLSCGSIAHFSKMGWISCYPTINSLKKFFIKNEFGKRVLNDIPNWKTDTINTVKKIEKELNIG